MKNRKLISVIVPIYKVEDFLDACIESLVNQTYSNLEIILVDDGSPDRCGEICDAWEKTDTRIRVIHKENGGLSDARNAGIRIANGSYIGFVDSDDVIHPRMYEILVDALEHMECEIACCNVTSDFQEESNAAAGNEPAYYWKLPSELLKNRLTSMEAIESLLRLERISVMVWNKLYKREVINQVWFPKGRYHEDEFWTYLVLDRAQNVAYIDAALYGYRLRPESITRKKYTSRHLDHLDARVQRLEYMKKNHPQFVFLESCNLRFECIRAMQLCYIHMQDEELIECQKRIVRIVKAYPLRYRAYKGLPTGRKIWCFMSNISFDFTCRVRNFFHYGP